MRLHALLLVFGALILASGTVRGVDRGQFEDVPDNTRAWFKGMRSPSGAVCCDISDWASNDLRCKGRRLLGTDRWRMVASSGNGGCSKRRQSTRRSRCLVCQSSR